MLKERCRNTTHYFAFFGLNGDLINENEIRMNEWLMGREKFFPSLRPFNLPSPFPSLRWTLKGQWDSLIISEAPQFFPLRVVEIMAGKDVANMVNPMVDSDAVIVITRKRTNSSTNVIRKASDTRIIGNADLNYALKVEKKLSENKIVGYGFGSIWLFVWKWNRSSTIYSTDYFHVTRNAPKDIGIPDEGEFEENKDDVPFEYSHGITGEEAARRLVIFGRNELPEKTIPKWLVANTTNRHFSAFISINRSPLLHFDLLNYLAVIHHDLFPRYIFIEQLWQPMPVMIWMAAIVEAGIQNYADMAILLFIQFANASIGFYEITKAGDAVAELKASLQVRNTSKIK